MTIYFNPTKDSAKPNNLAVKQDRVMEKDCIHLTECMWSIAEAKISFIGILGTDSNGIECFDDKSFKPGGQKVAFSFNRDENNVKNKDTGKWETELASAEQKLVFKVLSDALAALPEGTNCATAKMRPAASGILLDMWGSDNPAKRALIPDYTQHMFVFDPVQPKELSATDAEFVGALVKQKPGEYKTSGGNYKPAETEAEKLQARLAFLKAQMPILKSDTVLDMYLELKGIQNPDFEQAFAVVLRIIGGGK